MTGFKQLGGAWNYNAPSERFIDIYGAVPPGLSLTSGLVCYRRFSGVHFLPGYWSFHPGTRTLAHCKGHIASLWPFERVDFSVTLNYSWQKSFSAAQRGDSGLGQK